MSNKWLQNKAFIQWILFPSEEEQVYWEDFIQDHPELVKEIDEAIRILKSIKLDTGKLTPEEKLYLFKGIQKNIAERKRLRRYKIYLGVSAVACAALLLILLHPLFIKKTDPAQDRMVVSLQDTTLHTNEIQLVLSNSETITFENDADIQYGAEGEIMVTDGDEQIKAAESSTEEIAINTLIVPKGRRSSLTLADGTKVWVNSGSTLKFPTSFAADKRELWMEGEIYIEVKKNEFQPFYVNTSQMRIHVVGTRFNVMAYPEDPEHSVVLVNGRVDVTAADEKTSLFPNQMLSVRENGLSVRKVNVHDYISWKEGYLQFSNEPLTTILLRLSRYYDIPVECDESAGSIKCNGKLVLFDDIANVLKTIYHTIPIQYVVQDDKIIVSERAMN